MVSAPSEPDMKVPSPEPGASPPLLAAESEALRAVETFESVGATVFHVLFVDDQTQCTQAEALDGATLRQHLRHYLERNARQGESFIIRVDDPNLIQVDDCDATIRARLAPFAFLTFMTSPGRYQAWLSLSEATHTPVVRRRLLAHLAPSGANGTPCGGMRWPGSRNCKPKHRRPDGSFPIVTLVSVAPGRCVSAEELERNGLLTAPAGARLKPRLKKVLPRLASTAGLTRAAAYWNRRRALLLRYAGVTEYPGYSLRLAEWGHVRAERFAAQLDHLRRYYHVISLRDYLTAVRKGGRLPDYSVVLTFDEGHRNFLTAAAPRLLERGLPATVFVVPERTRSDGGPVPVKWSARDDEMYLSWAEIEAVRQQGFEVGVNLRRPSMFATYSLEAVKQWLSDAHAMLVARTKREAPPLAFRFGEHEPCIAEHARVLGFSCALRCGYIGTNDTRSEPFAVRRLYLDEQSVEDPALFAADVSTLKLWWCRLARHRIPEG